MSLEDGNAIIEKARVSMVIALSGIIHHGLSAKACFAKRDNVVRTLGKTQRWSKVLLTPLLDKRVNLKLRNQSPKWFQVLLWLQEDVCISK